VWANAVFRHHGSNLLKAGFEPSAQWAHVVAAFAALTSDVLKPVVTYCTIWLAIVAVAGLTAARLAIRFHKLSPELGSAIFTFCLVLALLSGGLAGLQRFTGDENGALAALVPGVERLQSRLGLVESNLKAVKEDTEALRQGQTREAAREEAAHSEVMAGLKRLERLQYDAAGGGAVSVKAIAEIRDILRPGNPEIDTVSVEKLAGLVERIIEDLKKPAVVAADLTGTVKEALTEAQVDAANLKFADAARVLDVAIAQTEAEDQKRARGRAALLAERGRIAGLQLRYRDAAGFYAKAADAVAFDTSISQRYRSDAAHALYSQGDEFGDNAALGQAISAYRSLVALTPREHSALDWATTQDNLGNALETLGERESGTAHLQEAVSAYRAALQERSRDRVPLDWAKTQNNLGSALMRLGERENGTARLQEAVSAYRAGLQERTRDRVPLDWATMQNNLGSALMRLGERESGTAHLQEAVSAYRAGLQELTRDRVPLEWASTQNDLGLALTSLGERENGRARLLEAVSAYRAALQERTRDRVPLAWATTQNNLGDALATLGERESGTARLKEAVSAYRAALQERTRDRVPLDWARTQNSLGDALATLGERESGRARLLEAVSAYRAALQERTRDRVPLAWATTQNNLGDALATLGERESGTARLEEAIAAFDACLTVTEMAWPKEWVQQVRSHRDETRAEITRRRAK
jgi:hypothetical protein